MELLDFVRFVCDDQKVNFENVKWVSIYLKHWCEWVLNLYFQKIIAQPLLQEAVLDLKTLWDVFCLFYAFFTLDIFAHNIGIKR